MAACVTVEEAMENRTKKCQNTERLISPPGTRGPGSTGERRLYYRIRSVAMGTHHDKLLPTPGAHTTMVGIRCFRV